MLLWCAAASADCVDVVTYRTLPHDLDTPNGVHISFFYDLSPKNEYVMRAAKGDGSVVTSSAYHLTMACEPAKVEWESDDAIVFTAGCGTFCWSASVWPLTPGSVEQSIMRPFAFDTARNLIAFYAKQDVIGVRNVLSLREQQIATRYQCVTASDSCLRDVHFTEGGLSYTAEIFDRENPGLAPRLESIVVPLDPELYRRPLPGQR